jgi:opacity protein-like surface antigen
MHRIWYTLAAALCGACVAPSRRWEAPAPDVPPVGMSVQGLVGLAEVEPRDFGFDTGSGQVQDADDATMPLIGGVFQYALAGRGPRIGLEGGFTFGWQGDFDAVLVQSGTLVVRLDNELVLWDLFGGVFADAMLGERVRVYAAAGPLLQVGSIDSRWDDPISGPQRVDDDGFGGGLYARGGIELALRPGLFIGLGYRVVDSQLDFGSPFGDVELRAEQIFLTVTESY